MTLRPAVRAVLTLTIAVLAGCGDHERTPPRPAAGATPSSDSTVVDSTASDMAAGEVTADDVGAALAVLRDYYAAIEARDYRGAYARWGDGGASSGQTYDEFAAGFAETAHVEVEIGTPGRVEAAAGSRYVEIPVVIRAVERDGTRQRFEGTYTLQRSVVDGATDAQRRWHLYRGAIRRVD